MNGIKEYLYSLATDKRQGIISSIIKVFLFILSLVYGLFVRFLSWINLGRARQFGLKIISVGNITFGGTGKTTLVEYIALFLKSRGNKVSVISRGYKRTPGANPADMESYRKLGDEPYMLSLNLRDIPVLSGTDRVSLIEEAVAKYSSDAVILDDAFQQWRVKKNLEIVAIDTVKFLGNRQLMPRGTLREPVSSLRRADVFALTKTDLAGDIKGIEEALSKINPGALIIHCIHQPIGIYEIDFPLKLQNPDIIRGKRIAALSGIGDPDSFEKLLKNAGADIVLTLRYPDHHNYQESDLKEIVEKLKTKQIDTIVTTQKDAVRFKSLAGRNLIRQIFVLKIELKITKNEEGFHSRLL